MMLTAYWILLVAGIMPYLLTPFMRGKSVDNREPRVGYAALPDGAQRRAYAAQQNSFEIFPFFALAVLVAVLEGADGPVLNALASLWVLLRVGYVIAYIKDMSGVRSGLFAAGIVVAAIIFTMPAWAV